MSLAGRFTTGLIWNSAGRSILYLTGIATSVAIARGLGNVGLGIYATLLTIPTILRLFSSLGFETILNIKLPAFLVLQDGKAKMRFLIQRLIWIRLCAIGVILIGLYFFLAPACVLIKKPELSTYLLPLSLYFLVLVMIPLISMVFRALLNMRALVILDGLNQIMNLIGIMIFLWLLGWGINGVLYAFVISTMITICVYCYMGREYLIGETSPVEKKELFGMGATAFTSSIVAFGLGIQIDIILLNYFGVTDSNIGFYHLGYSLSAMLGLFAQGIGGISQSVFSEAYARQGPSALGFSWKMVTKVFILMAFPIYIFALFHSPSIFRIFYGMEYIGASWVLRIFIISTSIQITVGSSFCMPAFYLLNQKRKGIAVQIVGGLVNVALDLVLIPLYGIWGAVIATAFSLVVTGLGRVMLLAKQIKVFPPLFFTGKVLVACLLALGPTLLLPISNIYALSLAGIVYGVVFVIMMSILKPLGEEEKRMVSMANPQLAAVTKYF